MDYAALKTLIDSDGANAARTDEEVVTWCNTASVGRNKTHLPAAEISNVVLSQVAEYTAMTDRQVAALNMILMVNDLVPVETGTAERTALEGILGTNTKTELGTRLPETVSPAENAGLGNVNLGDVQNARAL